MRALRRGVRWKHELSMSGKLERMGRFRNRTHLDDSLGCLPDLENEKIRERLEKEYDTGVMARGEVWTWTEFFMSPYCVYLCGYVMFCALIAKCLMRMFELLYKITYGPKAKSIEDVLEDKELPNSDVALSLAKLDHLEQFNDMFKK